MTTQNEEIVLPGEPYVIKVPWNIDWLAEMMVTGYDFTGMKIESGIPEGAVLHKVELVPWEFRVYFYFLIDPNGVTCNSNPALKVIEQPLTIRKEIPMHLVNGKVKEGPLEVD